MILAVDVPLVTTGCLIVSYRQDELGRPCHTLLTTAFQRRSFTCEFQLSSSHSRETHGSYHCSVAAHIAVGGHCLRRELTHSHVAEVSQQRLSQTSRRGQAPRRDTPGQYSARSLCLSPLHPQRDEVAGNDGEVQAGASRVHDHSSERPGGHGKVPGAMVRVLPGGWHGRRVP